MKHPNSHIAHCVLCVLVCFAAVQCKPKPEPVAEHSRPTWAVPDSIDMESSMTITGILPSDLYSSADTTDIVAAFWDNQCCGITHIQFVAGTPYFFLYLTRPFAATDTTHPITLRYYSTQTRHIYVTADAFTFVIDAILGTMDEPFVPAFRTTE